MKDAAKVELVELKGSPSALSIHPGVGMGQLFFKQLVLGGISSCAAATVTNPMEVLKIRMQLQGELRKGNHRLYTGIFQGLSTIAKSEGVLGIQRGLFPVYIYQIAMNGTRLATYGLWKRAISTSSGLKDTNFFVHVSAGALAGTCAALIANPFYLIKTRVQSVRFSYVDNVPTIRELPSRSGLRIASDMFKNEGAKAFSKGLGVGSIRTAVGSATQLATYEEAKRTLSHMNIPANTLPSHILSSIVSGACVVAAMSPFDVVYTRLVNQNAGTYTGILDCFIKVFKAEGLRGLYKGASVNYARLAPHSILTFVVLEQLNVLNTRHKWL